MQEKSAFFISGLGVSVTFNLDLQRSRLFLLEIVRQIDTQVGIENILIIASPGRRSF